MRPGTNILRGVASMAATRSLGRHAQRPQAQQESGKAFAVVERHVHAKRPGQPVPYLMCGEVEFQRCDRDVLLA